MNLKLLYVFMIFLFSSNLFSQDNIRLWEDGSLSWDDFKEEQSAANHSELFFSIDYEAKKEKFGDTSLISFVASSYMSPEFSWVDPDDKDEKYLRFNQLIFDVAELYSRKLQFELNRAANLTEVNKLVNKIFLFCRSRIDLLYKETNNGENIAALEKWEREISAELYEELVLHHGNPIPEFRRRNFGYAFHVGIGGAYYTNSLGDYFAPGFNMIYGFDLAYKRSILFFNATLAFSKMKKDMLYEKKWNKDQNTHLAILDASLGYAIIDNKNFKLSPFIGWGLTEFSGENQNDENDEEGLRLTDDNLIFGLNVDYKLKTTLKLVPTFGFKEIAETSIRGRLYLTKTDYFTGLSGYTINLAFGICGFGNLIKMK